MKQIMFVLLFYFSVDFNFFKLVYIKRRHGQLKHFIIKLVQLT